VTTSDHDQPQPPDSGTEAELTGRSSSFGFGGGVPSPPPQPELPPGTVIGDCRIERLIGRGGMGRIYEARQGSPQRLVAIKVLLEAGVSPEATLRFEHEAAALARLRHPGIAHVYTAGVADGPGGALPYLVMELIPHARSITAHADAENLPVRQRVELFVGVCEAAAHAHRQGLVHRDIKPGNILVEQGGAVKLIDFGIAHAMRRDDDPQATRDAAGARRSMGTPQYMSPEQFHESRDDLDQRSDVYSLGLVLYELVSGGRPYAVDSTRITEAARVVAHTPPQPLPSSIDPPLARVALKCLEKEPRLRYADAAALAADLRRYLNGDEVLAAPEPLWEAVVRIGRRHRAAMTATIVTLLSLAAAAAGISIFALRAREAEAIALREAARAREQARATQQLADFHESQFELERGRVRTAFALASRAYESGPAWEYGRQIGAIVDSARGAWNLVDRIDVAMPPAWIAFPRGSREYLVQGFADRVELHRLGDDAPLATAAIAGTCMPCPVAADRLAVVVPSSGIRVLAIPTLAVAGTCAIPGEVTSLRSNADGSRLAVLNRAGLAAVFDVAGRQVASRTFRVPGRSGRPGLAISPGGGRLVWHSGIWSEPKVHWDLAADEARPFKLAVHDLAFESETAVVGVWSPSSLSERVRLLRYDFTLDREPEGNGLGAIGVLYRQGSSVECVADAASGETAVAMVAPDSVSRVWMPLVEQVPAPRPLILMPLPEDGYGFSRVQAVLGEALWPHVHTPVAIPAYDAITETLALTTGSSVLVFSAKPARLAGMKEVPASSLACKACGTDFWSFHADDRETFACLGNELQIVSLANGEHRTVALEPPAPKPGRGMMAWGVTATPDGQTVAVLWQESAGGGHIGDTFHRKIATVYRLDADRRRATTQSSFRLDRFDGVNGRLNREFVITPDGDTIAFCTADGTVVGYRVADGATRYSFEAGDTFATHPPSGRFATGLSDRPGDFRIHDLRSGDVLSSWPLDASVTKGQFAPDGETIYIGLASGTLRQCRVPDGRIVSQLETALAPFAISHKGDRFVGRAEDNVSAAAAGAGGWTPGSLVVADLQTGRSVATLAPTAHILNRAAFGADDTWIAAVTERTVVRFTASVDPRQAAKLLEQTLPTPGNDAPRPSPTP
jgi:WD40 repeat protein